MSDVPKRILNMIEDHLCPGCVNGSDTKCGRFTVDKIDGGYSCKSHVSGTSMNFQLRIMLGMPVGFGNHIRDELNLKAWFFEEKSWACPGDDFDFPVWKLKENGRTFLKVVQPRPNRMQVHVIDSVENFDDIPCKDVTGKELGY